MPSMIKLADPGIFHTIQGEGHLTGQPMTFVRTATCSVSCPGCDTNYRLATKKSVEDIVSEVISVTPPEIRDRWVWLTGGEPTDQNINPLIRGLKKAGFAVAMATAGINRITAPVDWLSVSPHGELVQRYGNEIKIVPKLNGFNAEEWIRENDDTIDFWLRFLQPLDGDEDSQAECLRIQSLFPHWGLTLQTHKIWGFA